MAFQQKLIRSAFYLEFFIVFGFYVFGKQGIQNLFQLRAEVEKQRAEVAFIEQDIKKFEDEIVSWEQDPFYVEQAAREKLAMSYDGEDIYVVK